jgi:hypothetical protein
MPRGRGNARDWEHLFFLAIMLGFVVWYLWTAAAASPTFTNLILIAPVGAVASGLLLYVGLGEIVGREGVAETAPSDGTEPSAQTNAGRFRTGSAGIIVALMALFGLFVAAMPYIGFDVATFFFILATLWLLGERRVIFSFALALGISVVLSVAALTLLTFPIPLGIARSLWSFL